ncbi:hypothetical protein Bbelb_306080 [Branchiostoma belcheri]|nr:hypothetical protein Bbelb_306080 [Branchiostoma belcheri]
MSHHLGSRLVQVPPHFVFGIEVPNYDNCIWVRSSRQLNRVREGICKIVYCGGILARQYNQQQQKIEMKAWTYDGKIFIKTIHDERRSIAKPSDLDAFRNPDK